jgi:hypothetical protein
LEATQPPMLNLHFINSKAWKKITRMTNQHLAESLLRDLLAIECHMWAADHLRLDIGQRSIQRRMNIHLIIQKRLMKHSQCQMTLRWFLRCSSDRKNSVMVPSSTILAKETTGTLCLMS